MSQVALKVWFYWTVFLCDPTRPTFARAVPLWCHHLAAAASSAPERCFYETVLGSLLQGMTSSGHEVRWLASLGDVIPRAPMTGSRRCSRHRVRYSTVVARGWRLARLAASALSLWEKKEWENIQLQNAKEETLMGLKVTRSEWKFLISELVKLNKT